MLAAIAIDTSNRSIGMMNVDENTILDRNVETVDSHICFEELPSDSSEICIPKASEKESAMAMVNIPPSITSFEPEKEWRPTINPNVVIIPDVNPKQSPLNNEVFI